MGKVTEAVNLSAASAAWASALPFPWLSAPWSMLAWMWVNVSTGRPILANFLWVHQSHSVCWLLLAHLSYNSCLYFNLPSLLCQWNHCLQINAAWNPYLEVLNFISHFFYNQSLFLCSSILVWVLPSLTASFNPCLCVLNFVPVSFNRYLCVLESSSACPSILVSFDPCLCVPQSLSVCPPILFVFLNRCLCGHAFLGSAKFSCAAEKPARA